MTSFSGACAAMIAWNMCPSTAEDECYTIIQKAFTEAIGERDFAILVPENVDANLFVECMTKCVVTNNLHVTLYTVDARYRQKYVAVYRESQGSPKNLRGLRVKKKDGAEYVWLMDDISKLPQMHTCHVPAV